MNIILKGFAAAVVSLSLASCAYDNYDAPTVNLQIDVNDSTRVLNTTHGELFKLFQYKEDGYIAAGSSYIGVNVDQVGHCNALLFPGRYKMVVNTGGGLQNVHTWNDFPKDSLGKNDTLYFELGKGDMSLSFNVTPYYRVENFKAFYRNDSIISDFHLTQVHQPTGTEKANDLKPRSVSLLVSPTMFVNNSVAKFQTKGSGIKVDADNHIACSLKNYYSNSYYTNNYRNYAYVRIGMALRKDATEFIYSEIIKVDGIPDETVKKFHE